jgi:4-amino-4-deoxy-L-arabinose transferase-like glycosyltransferase
MVGVLTVPALVLRIWELNAVGANSDEAVYAGQAASLDGQGAFLPLFPVFRAHPLLFQSVLSVLYRGTGVSILVGRGLAVAFGMATVWLAYAIGTRLYGRRVGALAALLVGLMPYAVVVSRQILLDTPMTFFATLALYLLVRFVQTERSSWLYSASAALGLASLTKETAVLLLGGAYLFFALTRKFALGMRRILLSLGVFALTVLPYPLAMQLTGHSSAGGHFLAWQILRRPNHSWWFYVETTPAALGFGVVAVAVVGLLVMRRTLSWPEHLLLSWIVAPAVFFELWAVKGYQYLLPLSVPVAVLAAVVIVSVPLPRLHRPAWRWEVTTGWLRVAAATALAVSLAITSWTDVRSATAGSTYLAGTGGVPGGQEAGQWVEKNVPGSAQMLALGPSMANIVQFYGHRRVLGLSVSPNPLYRNPVYEAVHNPDAQIRRGDVQYLIWDAYSAARSPFFAQHLMAYVRRYHGRIVDQAFTEVDAAGGPVRKPVITIYEVRP